MGSKRRLARSGGIDGPEALRQWVLRHHTRIQAAYREHLRTGGGPDAVMWVMPTSESPADPPAAVLPLGRDEARRELIHALPSRRALHRDLDSPAMEGRFYVVASRAEGRFKGTFVGLLPIPDPGESLPRTATVTLPDPAVN